MPFDGARRGSGLGAAAWVLWIRDKRGHFEKLCHGRKNLKDNTAMDAAREALRMEVQCSSKLFRRKMNHFEFVISNSGSAAQYKIDATTLRVSRMTSALTFKKENCSLPHHVAGLHAMTSDDDLTWAPTSVSDVPRSEGGSPAWSPSSMCVEPLSVDGTSLGTPFSLPSGATLVSQNT